MAEHYYVQLVLPREMGPDAPPAISQETCLTDVRKLLDAHPFVLALDDAGNVSGVIPRKRILQRLELDNVYERQRWESMPLRALIDAGICYEPHGQKSNFERPIDCTLIADNRELIGITIEDDVFLSWQKLEPMLLAASCDPLTGLFNRQTYERRLNEEWARAERTGTSVAVVVVDLNQFKPINDCYGHQAGDMILQQVAKVLEQSLRSYDIVARYGGDEFVAICLGCEAGKIELPIVRIQRLMRTTDFTFKNQSLPVSVSIGAAVRLAGFDGATPNELFAAADKCLYAAKTSAGAGCFRELGCGNDSVVTVDHFELVEQSTRSQRRATVESAPSREDQT